MSPLEATSTLFHLCVIIVKRYGGKRMSITVVEGDLLDQKVEVIVNAWNRNIIPWWLLLPQGVSGAIKRKAGLRPFQELARHGAMRLGEAVLTGAGRLPYRNIIHVAGINMLWQATETSIRTSVSNAMHIVTTEGFRSVAFPIIGAGSGSFNQQRALAIMREELERIAPAEEVYVVVYAKK